MTAFLDEAQAELGILEVIQGLGYDYAFGPHIAHDGEQPERSGYSDVVLDGRLRAALERINPGVPDSAIEDAFRCVVHTNSPSLMENNRAFHQMLAEGVPVKYRDKDGRQVDDDLQLIDFNEPDNNDWLVVNQFTVIEGKRQRRPDVILFINGLPLVVIELKNPTDTNATLYAAYNQFQTYKQQIPSLFTYNALLIVSDGLAALAGTLTSTWERFMPWRTVDGEVVAPADLPQLDVLAQGMLDRQRLLDLVRHFVVYEDDGEQVSKKVAAYHQYHAVNKAVECTVKAASPDGDRRVGVVWHTQGSGKSLSMVFYAGKVIQHPAMENPTLIILTDRNDLDEQLFGTFAACKALLRQTPVQAQDRKHLRDLLNVSSGGVVFTTIQKFMPDAGSGQAYPQLSDRRNIVVIADEAHRSQYDFIDGFARHMRDALPNASWIGFTGTPIEAEDRSTPAVFGNYIDIYDIQQAVEDGATVRIYYEGRLAKLVLNESEKPAIDTDFQEVTESEEDRTRYQLQTKWARLEALVGTDKRLNLIAQDLVEHFEQRDAAMPGKAMIVCMSRRICVELYNAIIKLRPAWHNDDDDKGAIKVVMTGSASDPEDWQPHVRNKAGREDLAKRFKHPADELKLVLVRDMWLTGFDCPAMHTMYVDKPMRGHALMQAIARVNRVFKDKQGGLVVDYLGLADQLRKALHDYTASGGKGTATLDQEEAVAVMQEKYEIVCGLFHGFDYHAVLDGAVTQRMAGLAAALNHVLGLKEGKKRCLQAVLELSKAFALAVPHEQALAIKDEVGFFQSVRSALAKGNAAGGKSEVELDSAIRQIVSRAVTPDGVVDIFAAAGLKNPDISILSDEFLQEVKHLPHRNLAVELLQRLLNDQIKARSKKNLVQARTFSEMLEEAVRKYQNRAIEAAQVIQALIDLAKQMREAQQHGEALGLNEDETAFYDALADHEGVKEVLSDDTLKLIAHELVEAIRRSVSIDWTVRESARAHIRVIVKRILNRYGYPPDKQEKATQTVMEQAALLCGEIAA